MKISFYLTLLIFTTNNLFAGELDELDGCQFPPVESHLANSEYSDEFLQEWHSSVATCHKTHPPQTLSIYQLLILLTDYPAEAPVDELNISIEWSNLNWLWIEQEKYRNERLNALHEKLTVHTENIIKERFVGDINPIQLLNDSKAVWETYRSLACFNTLGDMNDSVQEEIRGNPWYANLLNCKNELLVSRILDLSTFLSIDEFQGYRMADLNELRYEFE
ncbi:hypothetical protein [Marinobacterium sp. xm-d-530]|uniref:hypothetical protein n=1 Tax=Marinobacterium sp. xm-d-530 TaxID=2497747 RepID=UPI00156A09B1|nr:hypothetical protein [Marinobacterium sp. xm-d-530]NRQ00827.1 hypothetical protein [Marinobacterium sp. xm-d-530]